MKSTIHVIPPASFNVVKKLADGRFLFEPTWYLFLFSVSLQAKAGAVIPVTGTSPLTYTATGNGTFFISGGSGVTATIVRGGMNVPSGVTAGPVPLRDNDELVLGWTTAPTMNFLPDR